MSAGIEGASRRAAAVIRGESSALSVVARIQAGIAPPGALADAWAALRSDRHAMAGFGRTIQKTLETAAAAKRVR